MRITCRRIAMLVAANVAFVGGSALAEPAHTVVGTLRLMPVESAALKATRTIRVWLPPGYDANADARYDVLYLHDGQNCFDRATTAFGTEWQIDETLTKLIEAKKIRPIIAVGIDNGGAARVGEYTFDADAKHGGGGAEAYATFVLDEVMPLVDKTFRTQAGPAHTFLGGSSLGGLVSLEIARRHPHTFGGVMAMSPSLWWSGAALTAAVEKDVGGLSGVRVWIDTGTGEEANASAETNQRYVDAVKRFDAALTAGHVEHHLEIDDVHRVHNEASWAARFPAAIQYLLSPNP